MKSTKCCQRSKRKTPDPAENRGADSMVRWLGMWSEQRYHRQGDSFGKIIQVYLFAKDLWKSISGNGALIKDRETHAKRRKWNAHTHIHTHTYRIYTCPSCVSPRKLILTRGIPAPV